ncbi:hypothetical protein K1719_022756 [Acacia pycnantha]|nr:hypothetical protein K1719_022756 [Acacia pycnantha]
MLMVLDDADTLEKLRFFARNQYGFGGGSRIIIITRDHNILKRLEEVDEIHKVELLNIEEALKLFYEIAFRCDYPIKRYEEVTFEALEYAGGLPLAIISLGTLLRGQSIVSEWHSALNDLIRS